MTAYQTDLGVVRSAPVWGGVSGAGGRLALPARPVPFGGLTTATGHTLAPNPFGAIDVIGSLPLEPVSDPAPTGYHLRLAKAAWNGLYAWLSDGTRSVGLYAGVEDWQPGQWRHLAVAWQAVQPGADYRRYILWVDGVLRNSQVLRRWSSPTDGHR